MLDLSVSFKIGELVDRVNDGWFDEEVYMYFKGILEDDSLCNDTAKHLLNGELKPYDLLTLSIGDVIVDYYISSNDYLFLHHDVYSLLKDRIYMLFDQAKNDCLKNKELKLTSHEFFLLCDDFESSSFDTISDIHDENVAFVVGLMKCVRIDTGIDNYENEKIYFNFNLDLEKLSKLKKWVEWSYRESFDAYLHPEDKEGFLKLRRKILDM